MVAKASKGARTGGNGKKWKDGVTSWEPLQPFLALLE
jgi:hypothetical protein